LRHNVDVVADCPTEKGTFWVDMGWPIVTNGEFVALLCENG